MNFQELNAPFLQIKVVYRACMLAGGSHQGKLAFN